MKLARNEGLHYHSYKMCKWQTLMTKTKVNHLMKTTSWTSWGILLCSTWTDFSQMKKTSARTCCTISRTKSGLPTIHMVNHVAWKPSSLKLWLSLGVSPVTVTSYHPTPLNIWLCEAAGDCGKTLAGRPYVWQQNLTPCNTSIKSQNWLS